MLAGEDLYAGDRASLNLRDGFVRQASWEDYKIGRYWTIPINVRKGNEVPAQIRVGSDTYPGKAPLSHLSIKKHHRKIRNI